MANRIRESSTDGTDSAEDEEVTIYEPSDSDEDVQHEALNNMWVTRHLAHSAHSAHLPFSLFHWVMQRLPLGLTMTVQCQASTSSGR